MHQQAAEHYAAPERLLRRHPVSFYVIATRGCKRWPVVLAGRVLNMGEQIGALPCQVHPVTEQVTGSMPQAER